jgi:hypothetical protein
LRKTIEWCVVNGLEPIVIDNHSDYPPLLEYYNTIPCNVLMLDANYGHTAIWTQGIIDKLGITGRYIITDPDLSYEGVPGDFLNVLNAGLDKYLQFHKCAFSLEINDLPDTEEGNLVKNVYEKKYWAPEAVLDDMYFYADTDTTFALYRETSREYNHSAIRTNRPYTARHLSWYYTDFNLLPEDEQNYYLTANDSASGKKRLLVK